MYISLIKNIKSSLTHLHGFQLLVLLSWFIKITFFHLYQKDKSESKLKFRQASNCCKRIAGAFNRSGATRAVALDISKALVRVLHAGLLHKLKSYIISSQIFGLISSFLSYRWLRVVLDEKSLQEYPVNTGVPQGSILGSTLFLLYINDLSDDVICKCCYLC